MGKKLSEKMKSIITDLRTIGNTDEEIAAILKIETSVVSDYKGIKFNNLEGDKDEMIRLYRDGWSTTKIGEKLGWSCVTVQKVLKKEIPDEYRAIKKIDNDTDAAIKQMLANGCSYKEICEKLDVSVTAINKRNKNVKSIKRLSKDETLKIAYLIYVDKKKFADIAMLFDLHITTVYRIRDKIEKAGGYEKWLESRK